jgi:hypothetical protein
MPPKSLLSQIFHRDGSAKNYKKSKGKPGGDPKGRIAASSALSAAQSPNTQPARSHLSVAYSGGTSSDCSLTDATAEAVGEITRANCSNAASSNAANSPLETSTEPTLAHKTYRVRGIPLKYKKGGLVELL